MYFCYNPKTKECSQNSLPENIQIEIPFVYDENLYIIGYTDEFSIYRYDHAADKWNVRNFNNF